MPTSCDNEITASNRSKTLHAKYKNYQLPKNVYIKTAVFFLRGMIEKMNL